VLGLLWGTLARRYRRVSFLSWNKPFLSELNGEFKTGGDMAISCKRADLDSIIAVIERSQILVAGFPVRPAFLSCRFDLPAGFEAVDVAVLEWIVAQRPRTAEEQRFVERRKK
jgi:hypothetical protein